MEEMMGFLAVILNMGMIQLASLKGKSERILEYR